MKKAAIAEVKPAAHFLSGPVYVEGAEPGDVLQIDILAVRPWMDWATWRSSR